MSLKTQAENSLFSNSANNFNKVNSDLSISDPFLTEKHHRMNKGNTNNKVIIGFRVF